MTVHFFSPYLLKKQLRDINLLLGEGKTGEAEEYLSSLPINSRIKINASLKRGKNDKTT